ncbi:hypothetical protein [Rugosimonospora africana]|uniref:Uncharacterized protein n=1 Tax=Rugosimonospora africana TaxID=556532 RepID=A0A8J3VWT2_9ACTN|nr:hypothetical protein [Rugosimonospora africana]GIH21219.1 hypothetical protein Raf01_93910 [Rugosimonospora africana]
MTADSVPAGDDPRRLLADSRRLAHRVRLAQRVTWFPLLVLAAVTFVAIPVQRWAPRAVSNCQPIAGGTRCTFWLVGAFVYWVLALVLAYALIAGCYLRVAQSRGLSSRVAPYVITGIALAVVLTAGGLVFHYLLTPPYPGVLVGVWRLVEPSGAIGVALLVLSWLERHLALLLFTVVYLVVVLVPITFGWGSHWGSRWGFAPSLVISGGLLMLGGLGFLLTQRRGRQR